MSRLKVVAISSSPRSKSITDKVLDTFLEGMEDKVEVTKFYPQKMKIRPCLGCWACWLKAPGKCSQKDDMHQILERIDKDDVIIFASPLYIFGLNAQMKTVLDRIIPILECDIALDEHGHCIHKRRNSESQKALLISTCGFFESDNFDLIKAHFDTLCKHAGMENTGHILIPASGSTLMPKMFDEQWKLIKQAGTEFIEKGKLSTELMSNLSKPVMDKDKYIEIVNMSFKKGLVNKAKMMFEVIKESMHS